MKPQLTHREWVAAATKRYGRDSDRWRFRCPCCGHVTSAVEWRSADASHAVAFSCIGRWIGAKRPAFGADGQTGPCDYAGGGLFPLNPVIVLFEGERHEVFDFADQPLAGQDSASNGSAAS